MGIYAKHSWERKRENNKSQNNNTAEKLLEINRELKLKGHKEPLEAEREKAEVLDNRTQRAKQCRKNKPCLLQIWNKTTTKKN